MAVKVPMGLIALLSALSLTSSPFLGFVVFIFLAAAGMSVQELWCDMMGQEH